MTPLRQRMIDAMVLRGFAARTQETYPFRRGPVGPASPAQRHSGQDHAILAARHALYSEAKAANPARWSGHTRNWDPVLVATLNPERDAIINAHLKGIDRQPLAA